ncbi:MAG: protein rep [candidate division Zixibacteria bacterium]|nr:protein rep [candidate division Zixibacteria bacterium]
MIHRDRSKLREVGGAQCRYADLDKIDLREQITTYIKEIALDYLREYQRTGIEWLKKKSDQLLKHASRFRYCGYEYILFNCNSYRQTYICPLRCESRICPQCAKKHYFRIKAKLFRMFRGLPCDGSKRLMLLTLTLRTHSDEEISTFDVRLLFKHVRQLITKLYPRAEGCGAVGVFEIGSTSNLHVHLIVYGDYVPQHKISDLWREITGDSFVVDIRKLTHRKKQVGYILKYIHKPHRGNDPEDVARYLDIITGVRRVHTYGVFYNFKFTANASVACFTCGGRLVFLRTNGGLDIPSGALFFAEAREKVRAAA